MAEHSPRMDGVSAMYEAGESCAKIASFIGGSPSTVRRHLMRCGVELREPKKQKGWSEEKAVSLYLSGRSAQSIAEEFGVTKAAVLVFLQRLGITRDLAVHHIDYDKQNCDESNLITLCHGCNARANGDRFHWQAHYSGLLRGRMAA